MASCHGLGKFWFKIRAAFNTAGKPTEAKGKSIFSGLGVPPRHDIVSRAQLSLMRRAAH